MDLIREASYGNAEAIDQLMKNVAASTIDSFDGVRGNLTALEQDLIDAINEVNLNEIEIGSKIDSQPFYDELLKMVTAGQIGADELNQALASIGYTPIVDTMEIPSSAADNMTAESEGQVTFTDPNTGKQYTIASDSATVRNYVQEDGSIKIPIIKGSNGGGGAAQIATQASMANALASSTFTGGTARNLSQANRNAGAKNRGRGGGSGSKPKKKSVEKKKDYIEAKKEEDRYHDIKEAIEDLDTELERLDKNKERAFGTKHLKYMDGEIKKTKEQIGLTQKYIKEIEKYRKIDEKALKGVLADIGMSKKEIEAQFGPDGILKSYEDLFSKIQDNFNNTAVAAMNAATKEYNEAVDR